MLVVSGRPQVLTDQLGEIDALVASWLPGSEGAGVADVLFGRRPFTGRLPVSWPRTEAQVPINVGDADYQPLFPFGWGLGTQPGRDRLAMLAADRPQLRATLVAADWNADGSLRDAPGTLRTLGRQLGAGQRDAALVEATLGLARDAAQATVVRGDAPADWATLIADADRAQLTGDPVRAFTLLTRVVR
ncbi:glycoside hydrolase family 3 C-terminal domain-containing protein [Micromonospora sp. NPDC047620]|uniref:glycoside hydrolase family 3 protein n=1 Tax=Micromonospora sp. NPDC047620 TaxID=3364251 RepID=UPI0037175CF7